MKVFVWDCLDACYSNSFGDGGVVVFAEDESRARELANLGACKIEDDEKPSAIREVMGGKEMAYWFPNGGSE